MAEYLIQGETLTNMADEIRTLSGTTGTMNPNEMTEHVADANAEITSQDALLDQAIAALEGKASGGAGGASVETCTVTVTGCEAVYYTGVENGAIVAKASTGTSTSATHNIVVCKNSMVVCALLLGGNITVTGGRLIASYQHSYSACEVTSGNASITTTNQGGSN